MHYPRVARRAWLGVWIVLVLLIAACTGPIVPEGALEPVAEEPVAAPTEVAAEEDAPVPAANPAPDVPTLQLAAAIPSDETYKGIPVGFTEDGLPYRGSPDAPIVMLEYSDYQCPFCNRYFIQTEPALDESYVRTGIVRVVFHDFPLASLHPQAPSVHMASLCVAEQGSAARYWQMHAEIFRSVDEWSRSGDPMSVMARLAESVGTDMDAYAACVDAGDQFVVVGDRVDIAFARGFGGTPSFQFVRASDDVVFEMVGAQPYEQFAGIIETALSGAMPQVAAQPEAQADAGIPFWATAEGLAPDPARPGYNVAGDQYKGNPDAAVVVIEFSDFQCPFCLRHSQVTQPILDEKYVDTDKVLWVFKHFPLTIHAQAPAAGVAAECAAEQGLFWEMHELLFEHMERWSIPDPLPIFDQLATELGLDMDAFAACSADPAIAARVDADLNDGAPYVRGTPTFIVLRGEQGSIIPGALPEETFSQVLDEELANAGVN